MDPLMTSIDPEKYKKHKEDEFWIKSLATLGGMGAGVTAGALAINPMEYLQRRRAQKEADEAREVANQMIRNFKVNQDNLRHLVEIHRGNISFDDIVPEDREAWRAMYRKHEALLNDPERLRKVLSQRPPAEIVRFPGASKSVLSQLLPTKDMLRHPLRTIRHPAPSLLGLVGGAAGGLVADRHIDKKMMELINEREGGEQE